MQMILIDRFIVPAQSRAAFFERANINRSLIKTLPGFVEDTFYEQQTGDNEYRYVTIAVWENEAAIADARQVVITEYQKQGFDMPAFIQQQNIQLERGVFTKLQGH